MMKKQAISTFLWIVLLMVMVSLPLPAAMAAEESGSPQFFQNIDYQKSSTIRAIIDDRQIVFDVNPQIVDGRLLVPMRAIFEAFGLSLSWDSATGTALGTNNDISIQFTIGSNKALVNGEEKMIDVPAKIISGNTMIPLRFLSENMDYHVVWIKSSNLILISQSDIIEWRYGGYETVEPYKVYENKYINGILTAETRYTGDNYDVKNYTLYDAKGRLVPNVPEFNVAQYGAGWNMQSPFTGKTYWIDIDAVNGTDDNSGFYAADSFAVISTDLLRASAPAGNYLKVKIDDHFIALEAWREIVDSPDSAIANIQDEKALEGQIIASSDALLAVTINDKYKGLISFDALLGSLFETDPDTANMILTRDPRKTFNWSDGTWNRLKGESPWIGMTKEMLLVQKQANPDFTSKITTKFSLLEIWVYENEFSDAVFCFDDGILTSMW